ncbi:MAG: SulP family inorganic anion transporter [Methylotenera sp.]
MVPEAIAFALIAHVSPLTGLYAAVMVFIHYFSFWRSSWHDFRRHRCIGCCYGRISCTARC